jgi:hypothetical protein
MSYGHGNGMRVVSANVEIPREVVWKGTTVRTAIFKEPVDGPPDDQDPESRR